MLDVPCGNGRIAAELAAAGLNVAGIDLSERQVRRARERSSDVEFALGDMRAIPWNAKFDCVLNWFGSFGYFDSATNRAVLRGFARALRPGGRLVLDQVNPRQLRRSVDAGRGSMVQLVDRGLDLMVDRVRIIGERSRNERFTVRDGHVRKLEFSIELIEDDRLEAWLHEAGFERVRLLDQAGHGFTSSSRRRIAVAVRGGGSAAAASG